MEEGRDGGMDRERERDAEIVKEKMEFCGGRRERGKNNGDNEGRGE